MTKDEITRMAREHGTGGWQTLDDMVQFGTAVAKAERERCADYVESEFVQDCAGLSKSSLIRRSSKTAEFIACCLRGLELP